MAEYPFLGTFQEMSPLINQSPPVTSYDLDVKRPRVWPSLDEFDAAAQPCENCGTSVVTLTVTIAGMGPDRVRTDVYEYGPATDPRWKVRMENHAPELCRAARRGAR